MAPTTMKAFKVVGSGKVEIQDVSIPRIREGHVLVKVHYVALNPIDWMNLDWMPIAGSTLGCDYSGKVVDVGPKVTRFKTGDSIAGWVLGNNIVRKDDGGFAEYCVASVDIAIKVPQDKMSDELAASPPAGIATAGMGVFQAHGIPVQSLFEGEKTGQILIYGGTSATSTLAIQYAKLAGLEVITTCSARNFDHVKSLGADVAFDYKDPDCAAKIREYTKDSLTVVFDTISKESSPKICAEAISSTKGGVISCTLPYPEDIGRKDVQVKMVFTLDIFGEDFGYGEQVIPGNPDDLKFGKEIYAAAEKLFHENKVKPHPIKPKEGGLKGIFEGLQGLKAGEGSGNKLVYQVGTNE